MKRMYKKHHQSHGSARRQHKFHNKVMRAVQEDFPVSKLVIPGTIRYTTSVNTQNVFTELNLCAVGELRNILANLVQVASSSNDFSENFDVRQAMIEGMMCNSGTASAIMDIYKVEPKVDNVNGPYQDYQQAYANNTSAGGEYASTLLTGEPAAAATYPGTSPFNLRQFCQKWTILNKWRWIIQPGETKQFCFKYPRKIRVRGARFQQGGTAYNAIKGQTVYWMILQYGQPAHDSVNANVGYAPTAIDMVYTKTYISMGVPSFSNNAGRSTVVVNNALPTVSVAKVEEELNPGATVTAQALT